MFGKGSVLLQNTNGRKSEACGSLKRKRVSTKRMCILEMVALREALSCCYIQSNCQFGKRGEL